MKIPLLISYRNLLQMLKTNIDLEGIDTTVIRPIAINAVEDIKRLISLNNNVYTSYDEEDSIYKTKNGSGKLSGQLNSQDEFVKVTYDVTNSVDNHELMLTVVNPETIPIYLDTDVNAQALFINHKRYLNINFTYGTNSQGKISSMVNRLRLMTSSDGMYSTHDLEYIISLPDWFYGILNEVNTLKNKRLVDKVDFDHYLASTFDNRLLVLNDHGGNVDKSNYAIREVQLRALGAIMDDLASINYDTITNGKFTLTFNYRIELELPVSLQVIYPILVYNTRINKKFRTFIEEKGFIDKGVRTYGSRGIYDIIDRPKGNLSLQKGKYYLTIPREDNIVLPLPPPNTVRLFSVLIMVDENDLRNLLNIKDLGLINFKDSVLKLLLEQERTFINDLYNSIFNFELYMDNYRSKIRLLLDELGNLRTELDLSMMKTYRLVINIVADTDFLLRQAKERLKAYVELEKEILIEARGRDLTTDYNKGKEYSFPETFIDNYITLLSVPTAEVNNAITKNYKDIMFNIKEPHWAKFYTQEILTNLTGFMKEIK